MPLCYFNSMKTRLPYGAKEYILVPLRESVPPYLLHQGDTPESIATYARAQIMPSMLQVETFWVVLLNTRRKVIGHVKISQGTLDTILVHAREVFKPAIIADAAAIVLMHNHPSGDSTPSESDIKVTRDLIRAGQLLKIEVLDHVILGHVSEQKNFCSLRELGYFYS